MRCLLDTHAILWYLFADTRLPDSTRKIIESNECYFSYASIWEISIKQSKKKLEFEHTIFEIADKCSQAGFLRLQITLNDFDKVRNLPFQENVKHNDPFDRILISQAINNDLTIITCDEKIPLYDVKTIW